MNSKLKTEIVACLAEPQYMAGSAEKYLRDILNIYPSLSASQIETVEGVLVEAADRKKNGKARRPDLVSTGTVKPAAGRKATDAEKREFARPLNTSRDAKKSAPTADLFGLDISTASAAAIWCAFGYDDPDDLLTDQLTDDAVCKRLAALASKYLHRFGAVMLDFERKALGQVAANTGRVNRFAFGAVVSVECFAPTRNNNPTRCVADAVSGHAGAA